MSFSNDIKLWNIFSWKFLSPFPYVSYRWVKLPLRSQHGKVKWHFPFYFLACSALQQLSMMPTCAHISLNNIPIPCHRRSCARARESPSSIGARAFDDDDSMPPISAQFSREVKTLTFETTTYWRMRIPNEEIEKSPARYVPTALRLFGGSAKVV